MRQLRYVLRFSGRAVPAEGTPGVIKASTSAASAAFETTVSTDGVRGTMKPVPGGEASFQSEVTLTGETSFLEAGTIAFGDGNVLRFSTVEHGYLGPSVDPDLQAGAVMWKIDGGEGQFDGASGFITSNFTLGKEGAVTDYHFGLIFLK